MQRQIAFLARSSFFVLLGFWGTVGLADSPPLPSSRFGTVLVAGTPAPEGTSIGARFGGVEIAAAATFVEGTDGAYRLDVPGDRPETADIEGPTAGQSFEILVGGAPALTAVWTEGVYTPLDLSAAAGADLRIELSDGVTSAGAGETLDFVLTLFNDGSGDASGVELRASLPEGAVFLSAGEGGSLAEGEIVWPLTTLADGQSTSRTFSYRLAGAYAAGIENVSTSAKVKHDGLAGIDPDPSDDLAVDTDTLEAAPDLKATLSDDRSSTQPGATLIYHLTVENVGTQDALGVVAFLELPVGTEFFSASHGGNEAGNVVTFPAFALAAGESVARSVTLRVPATLDPAITSFLASAEAHDDGTNGADLLQADNAADDTDAVEHLADLAVSAIDPSFALTDPQSLSISGSVAVTIANVGTLPAAACQLAVFEDSDGDAAFTRGVDHILGEIAIDELASLDSRVESVPISGELLFRGNRLFAMVDADRTVSEYDEANNTEKTGAHCVSSPTSAPFEPVVELSWPLAGVSTYLPNSIDSLSTPIVVQLTDDNGDGKWDEKDVADIVFVTVNLAPTFPFKPDFVLRAIRGDNGQAIFNVDGLFFDPTSFISLSGLAAGDIDNDGKPEILATLVNADNGSNILRAFEHNGAAKWSSAPYLTSPYAGGISNRDNPAIADLDGDGFAEIIVGANVFNRNGQLRWRGTGGQAYQTQKNNFSVGGAISVVADIDLDGSQEVITGNTVYRADGTIFWQRGETDGYPAVGNFDGDPQAEIVVVAQGFLRLHDTDGTLIWGPVQLPGSDPEAGGAPTVGDFDGDGQAEIGVAGSDVYVVYESDGTLRWQASTVDYSSSQTGSTIFDLDGDGAVEVIYRDERYLHIYRGTDGVELFRYPLSSTTMTEMPVVADVDGDGNAEILVTTDRAFDYAVPIRSAGLRVLGDAGDGWVAARAIWNQHAYAISNVEDDAGIPPQPAWGWLAHNSFRANLAPGGLVFASPDLTASRLSVDLTSLPTLRASVRVGNGGASRVAPGLRVAFYDGLPAPSTLLGVVTVASALPPGAFVDVSAEFAGISGLSGQLYAVVDDDGQGNERERECDEANNRHSLTYSLAALGLWMTKTSAVAAVGAGETVTYTLVVHNDFAGTASGVMVSDILPANSQFVSASAGGVASAGAVSWGPLTISSGGQVVLSLTLQVDEDLPLGITSLTNTASVADDGAQGPDLTPANNVASATVQVLTVSAKAGGPYAGLEGSAVSLDGSASFDRDGELVALAWDLDDDGEFDDADGATASKVFADEGTYRVRLRVVDNSGEVDIDEATVTISNVAPVVTPPATLAGYEGTQLGAQDFLVADPGSEDVLSINIDWGDGETTAAEVFGGRVVGHHLYAEDGSYLVEVCVDDGDGGSGCATATAEIANLPPDAFTTSVVGFSGWTQEEFGGGMTSRWRNSADERSVTEELNGQASFYVGSQPSYGTFEVTLRVSDPSDDDFVGFALGFSAGETSDVAGNYLLIDWKQANQLGAQKGLALSQVFGIPTAGEIWTHQDEAANGPGNTVSELARAATLGATGWARGTEYLFRFESSPGHLRVYVDGRLEIDYLGPVPFGMLALYDNSQQGVTFKGGLADSYLTGNEGEVLQARVRFVDPGILDIHTATIDWGDGSSGPAQASQESGVGEVNASHLFLDDGSFTMEVCVTDDEGESDCVLVPAVINNLPPVLSLNVVSTGYVEDPVTTAGTTFTDPGVLDTHSATIDWGDGNVETIVPTEANGSGTLDASHLYAAPGTYAARFCLADTDGGEQCEERTFVLVVSSLDLDLQKRVAPVEARPNANVVYTLTVKNLGTLPAAEVSLIDPLPVGLTYVSSTSGGSFAGGLVTWDLGTLAPGATVTRTVTARVAAVGVLPYGSVLQNTAQVTDNGANGQDGNNANNSATALLRISDDKTPIVAIAAPFTGVEGTALVLTGVTWADVGGGAHTGSIDWGDGNITSLTSSLGNSSGTIQAQHVYLDDGVYTLEVCTKDSAANQGCTATTATITNRPPEVASPGDIDMRLWRKEDFPVVSSDPDSIWEVAADGLSVTQRNNSRPAIFHSPFLTTDLRLKGVMRHVSALATFNDDDYLGFVLGFLPGETNNPNADFLLIDWKQGTQSFPSACGGAGLASMGLAVSRVSGFPTGGELWAHVDEACNGAGQGVSELARAATLGATGWIDNRDYIFVFEYDEDHLKIWVDGVLEFDLVGSFPVGRFGFYNYSQEAVRYRGFFEGQDSRFEGESFALAASFGDFGTLDTHTATADWDDGSTTELVVTEAGGAGIAAGNHAFPDDGDYRIEACVLDDDGGEGCGVFPLIVLNLPPVLTAAPNGQGYPGLSASFALATFTDPGVRDSHTATVDWGDGAAAEEAAVLEDAGAGSISASHAYAAAGTYVVEVCAQDDDGASACTTLEIEVLPSPPSILAAKTDLLVDRDGDGLATPGDDIVYQIEVSNVGGTQASAVTLTDPIPDHTTLIPGSLLPEVSIVSTDPVVLVVDRIESGTSITLQFAVKIENPIAAGVREIVNSGVVTTAEGQRVLTDDPDLPGSSDPTRTQVFASPALSFSKTATLIDRDGSKAASAGDEILWTLAGTVAGDTAATGLVLRDVLPPELSLVAGSLEVPGGQIVSVAPITATFEEVAVGETFSVRFRTLIDPDLPIEVEEVANQASLSSNETDLLLSDDPATPEPADPTRVPLVVPDFSSSSCSTETFDEALGADWQHAYIGNANQGDFGSVGAKLHLSGNGTELYHGDDNGHFVYRPVVGNFRAEVDIASIWQDTGGNSRKACLMVRSSLDPRAERAMACFLPHFSASASGLQFDARLNAGAAGIELASSVQNVPLPLRFAFVRRGDRLTVSYSRDGGASWIEPKGGLGGAVTLPVGNTLLVGTMVASYQSNTLFGADFDNFRTCRPTYTGDPIPGDHPICDSQRPLDVYYVVDLSESMKSALVGEANTKKVDAALQAVGLIQDQLALRQDGSRAALLTLAGVRTVEGNLQGSLALRAPLSSDSAALASALSNLDAGDILPLATTPTAIALEKLRALIASQGETSHQPIVILLTDGVPNIDRLGRGPLEYRLGEIQAIKLRDASGQFRPASEVAWLGTYNGTLETFDGETMANAMRAFDALAGVDDDLLVYGIALNGDGVELGTFNQDLVDYGAWVTGGHAYPVLDLVGRDNAVDAILGDLGCNAGGTAYLGDLVWNDFDGNGVVDPGEPGLPGVLLELLAPDGQVAASATTASDGSWEMSNVLPGLYTLRLATASLPGGIVEPTYDADGVATPAEVAIDARAFRVYRGLDFGYRALPPTDGGLAPTTVCEVDEFNSPLGAAWTLETIGGAGSGSAEIVNGKLELSSTGEELWEEESFHFLSQPLAEDFRVEVELSSLPLDPGGSNLRKTGLMVRANSAAKSPRIMVQLLPDLTSGQGPRLQFGYRGTLNGPAQSLADLAKVTLPVRIAIERRGDVYSAYYSTNDGLTWKRPTLGGVAQQDLALDLGASPLVGFSVASYNANALMTAAFDNFAVCRPSAVPAAEPPAAPTCYAEQPLDVVFLVDRSGSMTADYEGVADRRQAAQVAVEVLTGWLEDRQDGSRAALIVYGGGTTPAFNLASSTQVLSGLSEQFEALRDQLDNLDSAALDSGTPTASVIALDVSGELLRVGALPAHRKLIVWLTDEPPTIDRRGRGPYTRELQPLAIEFLDLEGQFLPWSEVAWRGPFVESLHTFAGEPLANTMQVVEALASEVPALEIHSLVLQGDGIETPVVRTDFLDYAAFFTSGSRRSAATTSELLQAVDLLLTQELSCQPE